ncbi:MAG: DUF1549 domain-containing protein [Gemmataceae bacterium]|jgi:hypothetical protein|nr:DUF1549 domain-containing protein [Gemmataceae bacterium]MBJ7344364.1 DUF1549 domain-containing protein [Gemmataceae bacterium]MBJ7432371.1 DUF1549 domain-containing protein [Gemmataceae bacterium]MCY2970478.1 DUF1549 domain-containing protein [Planctomycetota bacterium]RLS59229.1 MAG: DUF1549 domain-containing protein [Planctomycetota bacterium]
MAHKAKTKQFSFWHLVALGTVSTGLLLSADFSVAQEKETKKQATAKDDKEAKKDDKDSKEPAKKDDKEPLAEKSAPLPPYPVFPKLTIVGKTPDEKLITEQVVKSINQKLDASWRENKIVPSGFIDEYEFIRRVSLDVVGRIASPEEIAKYMRYPQASRRSQIIEDLLASEDYPRHWANHFTNWFLTRSGTFGKGKYHEETAVWLEDQFASNRGYHDLAKDVITASGENTENAAVNFILAHLGEPVPAAKQSQEGKFEMVPITSRITRLFLGIQMQCAQCHDHPFNNSITQKHFWGINAFLRQVERTGTPPAETGNRMMTLPKLGLKDNTSTNADGIIFFEKRNGVILPTKPIFMEEKKLSSGPAATGRRDQLAAFIIDHENFPKSAVNRMWSVFFGKGFTTPIDDFNEQNVPTNPELLQELASSFKNYNYDLKKLIRWICNSNAYNLTFVANKTNDKPEVEGLFSRMLLKSMSPEQLFESLMVSTKAEAAESKDAKKNLRTSWLNKLVSNFGDDEGNEVNFNGTVVQALLMMNGKDINDAISRKDKGTVSIAMARNKTNSNAIINELFLATLNRPARPAEALKISKGLAMRTKDKSPMDPYQDLFWALLNSNEFLLNH